MQIVTISITAERARGKDMALREQSGVPTFRTGCSSNTSTENASRQSIGTSSGLHPEDRPYQTNERRRQGPTNKQLISDEDDDALYTTRIPTSTRRYAPATTPPRTMIRVTRHEGPPVLRASRARAQIPTYEEPEQEPTRQGKQPLHFSVYVGFAMLIMLVGWIALSSFSHWWQVQQDNWTYGYPRTFQMDADVRHGGISHFTVENLDGHIVITEIQVSNLADAHVYLGPVFSGIGADLQPATISFADVNGDDYPDMIIAVGAGRYVLINTHTGFRPSTATDTIMGKGV
jgi:hypothetical protein